MLKFASLKNIERGIISGLFQKSYQRFIEEKPHRKKDELEKFQRIEKEAMTEKEKGFILTIDGKPIGFASWDIESDKKIGLVDHNCIIPEEQGRGYGKKQIQRILEIFRKKNLEKARVTTSEYPFFGPALNMYKSLGFKEVKRYDDPRYEDRSIDLELNL